MSSLPTSRVAVRIVVGVLLAGVLLTAGLLAGTAGDLDDSHDRHEPEWHERDSAYEQAREAVEHGEALPLQRVREHLQRVAPGKVVNTHYEFEFGRWVYEFKIIDPQGRLQKVHLDARSGELVQVSDY